MNIIELFFLMSPAYVANMTPVFARFLPGKAQLDFGLTWRGEPFLGSHKTWKGLIVGTAAGTIVGVLLAKSYWPIAVSPLHWSFLVSFGALFGDAVKSFFKRRMGIKSGKPWIPFDQLDFTVGALLFGSVVYFPGWTNAGIVLLGSMFGHIAVNHAAFYLRIRGERW